MEMIDEIVDDDRFVEIFISDKEFCKLLKEEKLCGKVVCNGEIISLAIIKENEGQ